MTMLSTIFNHIILGLYLIRSSDILLNFFTGKMDLGAENPIPSIYFLKKRPDLFYVAANESIHLIDRRQFTQPIQTFRHNEQEINQLTVNDKEEFLASADDSGIIKVFNMNTKRVYKTLRKHTNICSSVAFRPRHVWDLLSAGYDQRLIHYDFSKGRAVCDINIAEVGVDPNTFDHYVVNPPFIHSMSLSSDGNILACGTDNNLVQIFDASKRTLSYMTHLKGHSDAVAQVHFPSFDDYTLLSGGNDGVINMWKLNTIAATYHCNGYGPDSLGDGAAFGSGQGPSGSGQAPSGSGQGASASPEDSDDQASVVSSQDSVEIAGDDAGDAPPNGDVTSSGTRPVFGIQHDEKINWVTTGMTAARKYIVIADCCSRRVTVYNYPDQ